MAKKRPHLVTKGPVGNRKPAKNISQEPEMKQLETLFSEMDEGERQRTIEYLNEKDQRHD
jgi:hypothetical protein